MRSATKGEQALRAHNRAIRARAKRAESLDEAVSNKMDEGLANLEAERLLKVPENVVRSCDEAITPEFRLGFLVDTLRDEPTMINVIASEERLDLAARVGSGVAELAVDAAESVQAANSLEKMLCHQMAAAHRTTMRLIADGLNTELPLVEVARLSNAAARMMQIFQEGLLVLQKLRTGGKQTVVVRHVQVSDGGQAVIAGNVKSETGGSNG